MNYRLFLPLIALLILAACQPQRTDGYISRGTISVRTSHMDGVAARWDHNNMTILLSWSYNKYSIAHELCHSVDSLGVSYETAAMYLGDVKALPGEMAVVRSVLTEARKLSGKDAHWKALRNVCGVHAVGHSEIIARIK